MQNWDGSGGNGAALRHFESTARKYPLVVKLGTITPHGADVYRYVQDMKMLSYEGKRKDTDPFLLQHPNTRVYLLVCVNPQLRPRQGRPGGGPLPIAAVPCTPAHVCYPPCVF